MKDEESPTLPVELAEGSEAPWWKGLAEGRLVMPRCKGCGIWHWPAVFRCGACGSWEQGWEEVAPRGVIYTWTRMAAHRKGSSFEGRPVASVVVTLDEAGARLMGLLELEAEDAPVAIGDPVEGLFRWVDTGRGKMPAILWRQVALREQPAG